MEQENIISGTTEEEIWQQINVQFRTNPNPLDYTVIIEQNKRKVVLEIDIDLGGGFESGYENTTLTAELNPPPDFRFAIHDKNFIDEIGKFFGMEDVEIGFTEFDKKLIVKTNNKLRVRDFFSDEAMRKTFETLNDFTFGVTHNNNSTPLLEFRVETGITNTKQLREIYHAFISILIKLDNEVGLY